MTTELANRADTDLTTIPFTLRTLEKIMGTDFVPKGLKNRPEAILAAVLTGREVGLGPMASLRGIDIIEGNPSLAGQSLCALIWSAGHRLHDLEATNEKATVKGERIENGEVVATQTVTFTMADAERAGLAGKFNWKSYPRTMLRWRAVTEIARFLFADIDMGTKVTYSPDELGSEDWDGSAVPVLNEVDEVDGMNLDVSEAEVVVLHTDSEEAADSEPTVEPDPSDPSRPFETDSGPDTPTPPEVLSVVSEGEALDNVLDGLNGEVVDTIPHDPEKVKADAVKEARVMTGNWEDWIGEASREKLEARVRALFESMEKAELWRAVGEHDPLHRALRKFGEIDGDFQNDPKAEQPVTHWGDLRIKAHMVRFTGWVLGAAVKTITQHDEGEE